VSTRGQGVAWSARRIPYGRTLSLVIIIIIIIIWVEEVRPGGRETDTHILVGTAVSALRENKRSIIIIIIIIIIKPILTEAVI
jgi:hypothetical protein